MTPEQRTKIFEPFFTTKPTGTGLGMAISKRIIDEHDGQIAVSPEHLYICQDVVAEGDRLRYLQMRKARHDRIGMSFREVEQGAAQSVQQLQAIVGHLRRVGRLVGTERRQVVGVRHEDVFVHAARPHRIHHG